MYLLDEKNFPALPYHEVTNLFPKMSDDEYQDLVADIRKNGLHEPIWTYQGFIVDGRHCDQACREIGIEPRYQEWDGPGELIDFVISRNLMRRHLSTSQRAMVAVRIERQLALKAKQRRLANLKRGTLLPDVRFSEHRETGKSAVLAGEITKISKDTVLKAKKVVELAPELEDEVHSGIITLSEAKLLARFPEQQRVSVVGKVKSGEARKVKTAILDLHKATIEAQAQAKPTKPYISRASWEKWLPDQPSCDLLVTDPPYSTDVKDIAAFAKAWLPLALSKVKRSGRAYICIGAYPEELAAYLDVPTPPNINRRQILVWEYTNTLGPRPTHVYKQNWQAILHFVGVDAPPLDCPILTEQFSVQRIAAPDGRQGNHYHAWQKPDELAERLIRHSTRPGDLVLDCFAGTGTFLLAAHQLGRIAQGCDCSEAMLGIAEKRGCSVIRCDFGVMANQKEYGEAN